MIIVTTAFGIQVHVTIHKTLEIKFCFFDFKFKILKSLNFLFQRPIC